LQISQEAAASAATLVSSIPKSKYAPTIEESLVFEPQLNAEGLIPAIVTDAANGAVLMFAWMNREALDLTIATRTAHFWSRSRGKLWRKGEESGNALQLVEMRTDCDQDVIWLSVTVSGAGRACHTGRRSCFYRVVTDQTAGDGALRLEIDDPATT